MLISVLASTLVVVSVLLKNRKQSLAVQSASCLLEALYSLTILAYTSFVLNLSNFVRTFLFVQKDKFSSSVYLLILIAFEIVVVVNCFYTWAGIISLLPTVASAVRTYCLWQTDMRLIRFSGVVSGLFYSLYYLYYKGWFMIVGYAFLLIAGLYAIIVNDVLHKNAARS